MERTIDSEVTGQGPGVDTAYNVEMSTYRLF